MSKIQKWWVRPVWQSVKFNGIGDERANKEYDDDDDDDDYRLRNGAQPGLEPATYESQVRCPTDSVTYWMIFIVVVLNCRQQFRVSKRASSGLSGGLL